MYERFVIIIFKLYVFVLFFFLSEHLFPQHYPVLKAVLTTV